MSAPLAWSNSVGRPRLVRPRADPWLLAAAIALFGLLFIALFGERIAPHEPIYFVVEHGRDPRPYDPGIVFPFGSDVLGRDILSLVLAGAGTTLAIVCAGGIARVAAGVLLAALGGWWRPLRLVTESVAELVSAVPATLVALVIVKILVRADTAVLVFVGALLVIGWAGPYRVVRAEIDRLQHAPFTVGARALGVGGWRLFWRHQLPHLVPVLAVNLSQQVVASLVLVAELGVLGTFVGTSRSVSVEESLSVVRYGTLNVAQIADPPEWGGLLASARTIESLWTTRWLILVPGIAFALTAVAVAMIGFVLARRYARRDIVDDLRRPATLALVALPLVLLVSSAVVPERYAAAVSWANEARAELRTSGDVPAAFAEAGLRPIGHDYAVRREQSAIVRVTPATVTVGGVTVDEKTSRELNAPLNSRHVQAFVSSETGGGSVEGSLVFVGRGISPTEDPPALSTAVYVGKLPDLGSLIKDYPDDWAGIDVRGKVVVLTRFLGVATRPASSRIIANVFGTPAEASIARAIARGAVGVIFVDPALPLYTDGDDQYTYALGGVVGGPNPYLRAEAESPPSGTAGVPVVVVSTKFANVLVPSLGADLAPFARLDTLHQYAGTRSASRDLGITARIQVPLERRTSATTSYVGEVPSRTDVPRVLVWAPRRHGASPPVDVVAAVARVTGGREVPFIFVDFDRSLDEKGNVAAIAELLRGRTIGLVVVVDRLEGRALRITTPHGDLIPAMDLYAERSGARHEDTRTTATRSQLAGIAPFIDLRTVVLGSAGGEGDLRPDAAALLGYLAGRYALGAEELRR